MASMATTDTLPRLMSARQLYEIIGAGRKWKTFRVWVWRAARRGELRPIRTGPHGVAWRIDEVERWLATRPRAAGQDKAA